MTISALCQTLVFGVLVLVGLSACSHQQTKALRTNNAHQNVDLEKSLEMAFDDVRQGEAQKEKAHAAFAQAFTLYDDLHEHEKKALVQSDADKEYRAWLHERVLASSLLAALDAQKGRCALALPAVKDALRWDGFWHESGHADTALPALIGIYCATQLSQEQAKSGQQISSGYQNEIEFYEVELENALIALALNEAEDPKTLTNDVLRAAQQSAKQLSAEAKEGLRLVFSGRGEQARDVFHSSEESLAIDAGQNNEDDAPYLFPLWSSAEQKRHTRPRRFERTLKVRELVRMPIELAALFLLPKEVSSIDQVAQKGASRGLKQSARLIDTRRDERKVESIFAEVWWRSETSIEIPAEKIVLENETVRKALQKETR